MKTEQEMKAMATFTGEPRIYESDRRHLDEAHLVHEFGVFVKPSFGPPEHWSQWHKVHVQLRQYRGGDVRCYYYISDQMDGKAYSDLITLEDLEVVAKAGEAKEWTTVLEYAKSMKPWK